MSWIDQEGRCSNCYAKLDNKPAVQQPPIINAMLGALCKLYEIKAIQTEHGTWGVRVVLHDPAWTQDDAHELTGRLMEFWGV